MSTFRRKQWAKVHVVTSQKVVIILLWTVFWYHYYNFYFNFHTFTWAGPYCNFICTCHSFHVLLFEVVYLCSNFLRYVFYSFLQLRLSELQLISQFSLFSCCSYRIIITKLTILLHRSIALLPFDIIVTVFTLLDCNKGLDTHFAYYFAVWIVMDWLETTDCQYL